MKWRKSRAHRGRSRSPLPHLPTSGRCMDGAYTSSVFLDGGITMQCAPSNLEIDLASYNRLARLFVEIGQDTVWVRTTNVKALSLRIGSLPEDVRNAAIVVDGQRIELDEETWDLPDFTLTLSKEGSLWIVRSLCLLYGREGRISDQYDHLVALRSLRYPCRSSNRPYRQLPHNVCAHRHRHS